MYVNQNADRSVRDAKVNQWFQFQSMPLETWLLKIYSNASFKRKTC